jgi:hypothetical protein
VPELENLILLLQKKKELASNSDNKFLTALCSILSEEIDKTTFLQILQQYEKALNIYYTTPRYSSETTSQRLEHLYVIGYHVLSKHPYTVDNFLDRLQRVLLLDYQESLTKDDLIAMELLSKAVLKFQPSTILESAISFLHEAIDSQSYFKPDKKQVSLSSVVADDLLNRKNSYPEEETFKFLYALKSKTDLRTKFFIENMIPSIQRRRQYLIPDYKKIEDIIAAFDFAKQYFNDESADAAKKIFGFYMLIIYWDELRALKIGAIEAFNRLVHSPILSFRETSGLWLVADRLRIDKKREYFFGRDFRKLKFPATTEEFTDTLIGDGPFTIIEIVAANLLTQFTHPLIHPLIEEFSKTKYHDFCPGSDRFRKYLEEQAKNVKKI